MEAQASELVMAPIEVHARDAGAVADRLKRLPTPAFTR
jgi:hypothetical protein